MEPKITIIHKALESAVILIFLSVRLLTESLHRKSVIHVLLSFYIGMFMDCLMAAINDEGFQLPSLEAQMLIPSPLLSLNGQTQIHLQCNTLQKLWYRELKPV